jgi:NAD(P)-dependent dehydrogenase (short-subunit alcohol dehydrogenase family)
MTSLRTLQDMSGQVALITGGGGHVARVAAEALAELGAGVVLLDIEVDSCADAVDALRSTFGAPVRAVSCDLEDTEQVGSVVRHVIESDGRLDVVVNCAAFVGSSDLGGWSTDFASQSPTTFLRALGVNLVAPFALVQAAAAALRDSPGGGAVINVSSIYGQLGPDMRLYDDLPMGNPAGYAASKGGLEQLTRWLATVLAPDIRVNGIAPGGIYRHQDDEFVRRYNQRTPMARMATEDDLRGAFAYLGSGLSCYVTGQTITVDGGWTAW